MRRQSASARFVRRAPCEEQYDRAFLAGSRLALRRRAFTGSDAMSAASLAAAAEGDHVALLASGAWTVERAAELERLIEDASRQHAGARSIDIDLAGLERLDTFGAWLIERLKRSFLRRGSAARITGLSETDRALMAELRAVNQIAFKKWRRPTRSSSRSMPSAATSPRSAALSCWSCSFSAHWCWRRSARSRIRGGCASRRSCIIWKKLPCHRAGRPVRAVLCRHRDVADEQQPAGDQRARPRRRLRRGDRAQPRQHRRVRRRDPGLCRRLGRGQVGADARHNRAVAEAARNGRGVRQRPRGAQWTAAPCDRAALGRAVPAGRAVLITDRLAERAISDARVFAALAAADGRDRARQARNGGACVRTCAANIRPSFPAA